MAKGILSVLLIFLVWSGLDFVIHELVLKSAYEASSYLWRLADQEKTNLAHLNVLVSSIVFVSLYASFAEESVEGSRHPRDFSRCVFLVNNAMCCQLMYFLLRQPHLRLRLCHVRRP